MVKEQSAVDIKVGDRPPIFGGARVTDVRYAKQGAIGFEIDDPETLQRIEDAIKVYSEAVREDQLRPRDIEPLYIPPDLVFNSPSVM